MKTVEILEGHDAIKPTDYMRPLTLIPLNPQSDVTEIESYSPYSGDPVNNVRWIKVKDYFGECHWDKTVDQIHEEFNKMHHSMNQQLRFEFVRGDIPSEHIWYWKE